MRTIYLLRNQLDRSLIKFVVTGEGCLNSQRMRMPTALRLTALAIVFDGVTPEPIIIKDSIHRLHEPDKLFDLIRSIDVDSTFFTVLGLTDSLSHDKRIDSKSRKAFRTYDNTVRSISKNQDVDIMNTKKEPVKTSPQPQRQVPVPAKAPTPIGEVDRLMAMFNKL